MDNTLHTIMARLPRGHTSEDNACKKYEKSNRYRENTRASVVDWQLESCAPCTEWRRQEMNGTSRSIAISRTPGNENGWRTMQYQQLQPQQRTRRKKQDIFLLETDNFRGPAFQVVACQNWQHAGADRRCAMFAGITRLLGEQNLRNRFLKQKHLTLIPLTCWGPVMYQV